CGAVHRQTPEAGARCVNRARRDLCGGYPVTGIPTATFIGDQNMHQQLDIVMQWRRGIYFSEVEMMLDAACGSSHDD
ncbi:hypothetical protein ACYCMM_27035, partial [Klebsiella pneumoniae]